MIARKQKKPVPHISELPPMGADFYFDLLPKLGEQDEQMREAMKILRHPWAMLVLDPETDRYQAQIALANLIKKAYLLGYEEANRLAALRNNAAKASATAAKLTDEERSTYRCEADDFRAKAAACLEAAKQTTSAEEKTKLLDRVKQYASPSWIAKHLIDLHEIHHRISHRQMRRIVGGK